MEAATIFSRILSAFETGEYIGACAWCGHVRIDGVWVEPPPAVVDAIETRQILSHSICDDCAAPYLEAALQAADPDRGRRIGRLAF